MVVCGLFELWFVGRCLVCAGRCLCCWVCLRWLVPLIVLGCADCLVGMSCLFGLLAVVTVCLLVGLCSLVLFLCLLFTV